MPRNERDLRSCPLFCSDDKNLWKVQENIPWPAEGERLLDYAVGSEMFIHAYSEWVQSDLERLWYFAIQYHDGARNAVRVWLRSGEGAENVAYVVGYLYRHAIELRLKAIIAESKWFEELERGKQKEILKQHSLHKLWNKAKVLLQDYIDTPKMVVVGSQILELHELDKKSDGFRYPFGFRGSSGEREGLVAGLAYSSFDNFVWILDGIASWLSSTLDEKQNYLDYNAEHRDFG